jgi:putative hydrolase of HD superfamily
MYRMGMMSLIAGDSHGVDSNKCMRMSLVHDVAESLVGDITPSGDGAADGQQKVSKEDKARMEAEAIRTIQGMLGEGSAAATEVAMLWHEYEAGVSPEAQLVKDFDKLEMILQAEEYEAAQGILLQEFFDSTEGRFKTSLVGDWAAELVRRRKWRKASH